EPEGNAACGKALREPEIATVERRRRAPLARGRGASCGAPRAGHGAHTGCSTRHPGACRRSAVPLWGGGNDATRLRSDAGKMRKEKWEWRRRENERESEEWEDTRTGNVPGNEKLRCLTS